MDCHFQPIDNPWYGELLVPAPGLQTPSNWEVLCQAGSYGSIHFSDTFKTISDTRARLMRKLKVAIVGCGAVARDSQIPAFRRLGDRIELCAVCDLNYGLAKHVASNQHIAEAYESLSSMLSKEKPDIVSVCTNPQSHASLTEQSLEAGCHVLVEKPMATSLAECDMMIRKAEADGLKLCTVHMKRFLPPFLKAKEMVEKGLIGTLIGLRFLAVYTVWHGGLLARPDHWVHSLPGGIFWETGPHPIYMTLVLAGHVKEARVVSKNITPYPWVAHSDYHIELVGEKANSSIHISFGNMYTTDECDIFGAESMLNINLQSMLLKRYRRCTYKRRELVSHAFSEVAQIAGGVVSNVFQVLAGRTHIYHGHDVLIERFVDCIINDSEPPVPPEEARETIRVMEMVSRSL
ncbi:MAG: Gfo/Idh/MocA family oxidoreductase [Candidatus Bathyarchaeia archaeon]